MDLKGVGTRGFSNPLRYLASCPRFLKGIAATCHGACGPILPQAV